MAVTSRDLKEALLELDRAKKNRPALFGPVDFFSEILPRLFEGESVDPCPPLNADHARTKLADGIPMLRGEKVEIDAARFGRRWLVIAAAVERHQNKNSGKALAEVWSHERLDVQSIVAAALSGSPESLHEQAEAMGLEPDLMGTVVRLSLFPVLVQWNATLEVLRGHFIWERGYCATCGSWPLLGEFRGLEQTRLLRCGWCAAEWKVPRLFCPYCENRDHHSLGYLSVEGDGSKYRIDTCDLCRGYLKMLTTLTPLNWPQLLAADVATMHLDLAALEKAYGAQRGEEE